MGNALLCMVNAGTRVYPRDSNGNNGFAMHCDVRQPPVDGDVGVTFFHIRIAVESTNDVLRKVHDNQQIEVKPLPGRLTYGEEWEQEGIYVLSTFLTFPDGAPQCRTLVKTPGVLETATLWQVTGRSAEDNIPNAIWWTKVEGRNPVMKDIKVF